MPTRRVFLKMMSLAGAAAALLPGRAAQAKKVGVPLAKYEALKNIGGQVMLEIKGETVLLFRVDDTTVKAVSGICTHKKCKVAYNHDKKKIGCKCHKSHYSLDGVNEDGPAPKPLKKYDATLEAERIVLDLGEIAE
jgi:Rieske Fe-S protein